MMGAFKKVPYEEYPRLDVDQFVFSSFRQVLQSLGKPHVDSFNWMVDEGLDLAVNDLDPAYLDVSGHRYKFWISVRFYSVPL